MGVGGGGIYTIIHHSPRCVFLLFSFLFAAADKLPAVTFRGADRIQAALNCKFRRRAGRGHFHRCKFIIAIVMSILLLLEFKQFINAIRIQAALNRQFRRRAGRSNFYRCEFIIGIIMSIIMSILLLLEFKQFIVANWY